MAERSRNRHIYELWTYIQDIIDSASLWPYRIRRSFWKQGVQHLDRILLATVVLVNVLNPEVFMEWARLIRLGRDGAAYRHFDALLRLLPERNYILYANNITNNRYEYLDGSVRHYTHASERNNN